MNCNHPVFVDSPLIRDAEETAISGRRRAATTSCWLSGKSKVTRNRFPGQPVCLGRVRSLGSARYMGACRCGRKLVSERTLMKQERAIGRVWLCLQPRKTENHRVGFCITGLFRAQYSRRGRHLVHRNGRFIFTTEFRRSCHAVNKIRR